MTRLMETDMGSHMKGEEPTMIKREWKIPVVWSMYGKVMVEAETIEKAIELALDPSTPLPDDGEYLLESLEVDKEGLLLYNDVDEEELLLCNNLANAKSRIWTVSIKDREDAEMSIWTTSFSTEEKADAFKAAVEEKLKGYGVLETVDVIKDCSELDDDMYLSWIDDRYGEDGECY